jgi:tetratricopeptide (TPR) repeat protein
MSERETAEEHRIAAEAAEAATQWRDAVREYEECLSIVSQAADDAGQDEVALLTGLGRCYWNLAEARTAWRTLRRAISLTKDSGDGVAQARATVEILHIWGPPERHKMMAEEALEALGDGDAYLKARLLLDLSFQTHDDRSSLEKALDIADEHQFEDILATRIQNQAWEKYEAGDIDEAIRFFEQAHAAYASQDVYHVAGGVLRGAGFNMLQVGRLDEGYRLAERSFEYTSNVNLLFGAQLALMDMIGVAYARGEFEKCEELLASSPGDSDFRADCYRMWIAEARGDVDGAMRLIIDPDRGGKATTAVGQIHATSAGMLYRIGKHDAATQALQAWVDVDRGDNSEPYWMEAPAAMECILAQGDEALHRKIYDAFVHQDEIVRIPARFSVLQGRAVAPIRGGACAKLGLLDEAERHYREGLAWCEQERCTRDAELCREGLRAVATLREATP